jgi:hypothetical protein
MGCLEENVQAMPDVLMKLWGHSFGLGNPEYYLPVMTPMLQAPEYPASI